MSAKVIKHPLAIGLVGGIASGKSQVARYLATKGAAIIDADKLGHQVLEKPLVIRSLTNRFGPEITSLSGAIDRDKLGALVFGEGENARRNLEFLEQTVHPMIHAEAVRKLQEYRKSKQPPPAVVLDAPLLIEAGWNSMCNHILFVDTLVDTRKQRALARGWNEEQFEQREAAQLSVEEKKQYASHVVSGEDNAAMQDQIDAFWEDVT